MPDSAGVQPKPLLTSQEITDATEAHIRHPWNPKSDIYLKRLSVLAGLTRVVLSLVRIPPHKESFLYHRHERDEEFVYILSGRGRAEIGNAGLRGRPRRLYGVSGAGRPGASPAEPLQR